MNSIRQPIRDYLLEEFFGGDESKLTNDTPLLSGGVIDSISALQLVEFLENTFNIEFEAHEVDQENLDNLDTMVAFVEKKKEA